LLEQKQNLSTAFCPRIEAVQIPMQKCVFIFNILTSPLLKIVVLWDVYAVSTGKQLLMSRKIIIINLKSREPKKF